MTEHNVLACVDGSAVGTSVCDFGAWASLALQKPLKLLHVIEKSHTPSMDDLSGSLGFGGREQILQELSELDARRHIVAIEHGKAILADAAQRAEAAGVKDPEKSQRHDRLMTALLAEQPRTELVVMGRQGNDHDDGTAAVGSHIENVVRTLTTPILMAVGAFAKPTAFMIAYDGSASADAAIAGIAGSGLLDGLTGHVMMVGDDSADNRAKLEVVQAALAKQGHSVQTHLRQGQVVEQLVACQTELKVPLTIMGAYSHNRFTEFFVGSNTSRMLVASQGPVLIMR